ncbi:cystatin C (amyloid angiopathy and cerebral hemorrhage) [Cololabis saira]|uniref:cystatin C (amyloid angiopathy and cerebral hemorrhage) n=1 Tax=Cololabis saira TaxID=129043 RepID=UPI002AD56A35|nr:cystatin C (amyloid angiopathy and cerebral hemorrhage) [Cololabis saira]
MMWKIAFVCLSALFTVGLTGLVGGFTDVDVNDERVQNAMNFAVAQHNRKLNDMYLRQVVEVVKAKSQVVAGMKYVITVKMARSSCRKNSANEECSNHADPAQAMPYQCTFTVWSRPWLSDIQLLNEKC